jgi:hypothetical protein
MAEKSAFMSGEWVLALEQIAQGLLDTSDASGDTDFTYAEIFTGSPEPRSDGNQTGYVMSFKGRKATVRSGVREVEPANCSVWIDYQAAADSLGVKSGTELGELMRKAGAEGKMRMIGSMDGVPVSMHELHDAICDRSSLTRATDNNAFAKGRALNEYKKSSPSQSAPSGRSG